MNKVTAIAAIIGVATLGAATVSTHADSRDSVDLQTVSIDMQDALLAANVPTQSVIEIELENEDNQTVWEIEYVSDDNRKMEITVDAMTGAIIESEDDGRAKMQAPAFSMDQVLPLVLSLESGSPVEVELEKKRGGLVWEVETVNADAEEKEILINAETGELIG